MPNSPKPKANGRLAMLIGAPAATLLMATIAGWEGYRPTGYLDRLAKPAVPTICWGDTQDAQVGRTATREECEERLERQALNHVGPILQCVPNLRGRPNIIVASGSLSYNIGVAAFCRSTIARHFRAGRWREGCNAFMAWRFAGGRELRGLVNRRRQEREICLRDADRA